MMHSGFIIRSRPTRRAVLKANTLPGRWSIAEAPIPRELSRRSLIGACACCAA